MKKELDELDELDVSEIPIWQQHAHVNAVLEKFIHLRQPEPHKLKGF